MTHVTRFLASLTIFLTAACSSSPVSNSQPPVEPAPGTPMPVSTMAASSAPPPTAGAITARPSAEFSPDGQAAQMIFTAYGANDHAIVGGSIFLGSPQGLMRIDPRSNQASIVDHDPGSALWALRDTLWRSAWTTGDVYRYDALSAQRTLEAKVSLPVGIYASDNAVWVAEHEAGDVVRLDPQTGSPLGRTRARARRRLLWPSRSTACRRRTLVDRRLGEKGVRARLSRRGSPRRNRSATPSRTAASLRTGLDLGTRGHRLRRRRARAGLVVPN